eukprot:CAMPEP_0113946552 /NCGR_PEP_ID=MMETSP1339-20121228/58585_1 /TAXON_ID=94617 /ORGANISM="Fibrocapsa japonica" /LENGTH=117 /DNA_ID=CAMNT_0000952697 /DNA_START=957 /DNA_END=1307 /DNA_ORIENTATION=- /assembly_acc=CAM_ASM_000762
MDVLDTQHHTCSVEPRGGDLEPANGRVPYQRHPVIDVRPQLPALHELGEHVELVPVLEGGHQVQDQRVLAPHQDVLLVNDVLLLAQRRNLRLGQALQGQHPPVRLHLHQLDNPEGAG